LAEVDALDGWIQRLLVADEQVRRMLVVGPHRDLIGRVLDGTRDQGRLQPARELERIDARPVERAKRALCERMMEAEELHRVSAQLIGDERSEVSVQAVRCRPGDEGQRGDARNHHAFPYERLLHVLPPDAYRLQHVWPRYERRITFTKRREPQRRDSDRSSLMTMNSSGSGWPGTRPALNG